MSGNSTTSRDNRTVTVLTVEEAAQVLRISRQSAYQAARAGELPTVKIGRRLLVPRARLEQMLGLNDDAPAGQSERVDTTSAGGDGRDDSGG
jgi:excisionase family DNA binding protein